MTDHLTEPGNAAKLLRQRDLILAAAGDGIYGVDVHGNTMFVNPAATRACGYTREEMLGANLHDLIHHSRADGSPYHVHDCPIFAAAHDGKIHRVSTEVFWRKDGSSFPVEYVSTPIWDKGTLTGAVVSFRDISERRIAEEAMRESEQRARHLQAELHHVSRLGAMGEMASAMAHELNQPLTAVMNFMQAAKHVLAAGGDGSRDKALDLTDKAVAQATRAGDIIRGLRSFVEKSEADMSFENINDIIEEAILLTIPGTIRERVDFQQDLSSTLPDLFVHKIKIQQVIVNLVRNAIEAMDDAPDGKLIVSTKLNTDGHVQISVRDNGHGLSEEQLQDVFQSFMTTKQQGMGVGLSICRSIIEDHDGRMWAENNAEGGATFFFALSAVAPGSDALG